MDMWDIQEAPKREAEKYIYCRGILEVRLLVTHYEYVNFQLGIIECSKKRILENASPTQFYLCSLNYKSFKERLKPTKP